MNSEPPLTTLTNPELEDWLRMSSSHVLFHWDTPWVKTNRLGSIIISIISDDDDDEVD